MDLLKVFARDRSPARKLRLRRLTLVALGFGKLKRGESVTLFQLRYADNVCQPRAFAHQRLGALRIRPEIGGFG
jgi:hypothetical protein